jgi:transmembrane sensor
MHGTNELQDHPEQLVECAIRGELSPSNRTQLDRHLAECPECAVVLDGAQIFSAAMAPGKQDDALNHAAVMKALVRLKASETFGEMLRRTLAPERLLRPATALFAVVAMVAAGFALLYMRRPPRPLLAPVASSQPLILDDGSEVAPVDGRAAIQLVEQTPARATVRLRSGSAQFRIRHDSRRLFRVDTGPIQVEDIGTAFRVDHETGDRIRVAVSEGRVAVQHLANGWRVELGAGENRVFSAVTEVVDPVKQAPVVPALSAAADGTRAESRSRGADEPAELLTAADVARRSRQPQAAVAPLRRLMERYPKDPRAPAAAFTLGWVLLTDLGRPSEAAAAFATAERSAPRGGLAEDAAARVAEAWQKAGDSRRAAEAARHYERVYPSGRYITLMRGLIGEN